MRGVLPTFLQDVPVGWRTGSQLTTDGHRMYSMAVPDAFEADVDYMPGQPRAFTDGTFLVGSHPASRLVSD